MTPPPGAHAAVMGTGIVSVALLLDREVTLSRALMWVTTCLWAGLTVALAIHAVLRKGQIDFARVWVWPALALWALVAVGSLRRLRGIRGQRGDLRAFAGDQQHHHSASS